MHTMVIFNIIQNILMDAVVIPNIVQSILMDEMAILEHVLFS
jgi:hypothetical protein